MDRTRQTRDDYYGSPTERKATRRFERMFGILLFDSPTHIEDQETEALPSKERDQRDA